MDSDLQRCLNLLKDNEPVVRNKACMVLLIFCRNILKHPRERKYRHIRLDNPTVTDKLLPAIGAMECLFCVGFVEDGDRLTLPFDAPLTGLQALHNLLSIANEIGSSYSSSDESIATATKVLDKRRFFERIIKHSHDVLYCENPVAQEKARQIMPIVEFEINVMKRIRELQRQSKINCLKNERNLQLNERKEIAPRDFLLIELLDWFKYKFFKWDSGFKCPTCSQECTLYKVIKLPNPRCYKMEIHKCKKCNTKVEFPRCTDPEILLKTRRGRCGEWAYTFTLLCRSLGYDARNVFDETDHVWTEVWSITHERWIHVDPCENVIDKPLMYEKGWRKKLSYIIAFSKDEVQDVTWRYTRDPTDVMKRRNFCSEESLMQFIRNLNERIQNSPEYSAQRKRYVIKRSALELAEMLYAPNQEDDENEVYQERSSGSYAWRLARGEITPETTAQNFVWDVSKYGRTFQLRYFIVKDVYRVVSEDGSVLEEKSHWQDAVNATEGKMFRKVEHDWKTAYLVRSEDSLCGKVKWSFEVKDSHLCMHTFSLRAKTATFHSGMVTGEVEGYFPQREDGHCNSLVLPVSDFNDFVTEKFKGATRLTVTAVVSAGSGENAWQHAQLFREKLENVDEPSMIIDIRLDKRF